MPHPTAHWQKLWDAWLDPEARTEALDAYHRKQTSFLPNLLPERALTFSTPETLNLLRGRLGVALDRALDPANVDPAAPPAALASPVRDCVDGTWLKTANVVGINVRTIGTFWNVVKYVLTLPDCYLAIHLLPIWEPGVLASLYAISSWRINDEFFSLELADSLPHLDTADKQLRAVTNVLHAMGRVVGMDVIPHTDRFAEITLANPHYFEWVQRNGATLVDHTANVHKAVQERIVAFLVEHGAAERSDGDPRDFGDLFAWAEERRLRALFGTPEDRPGRLKRRIDLIKHLVATGYEPVPATMAPPYRGLRIDPRQESLIVDELGMEWREYSMIRPQPMSRIFGPLTRFKLFERLNDNQHWEIDFDRPRVDVWDYVCRKYGEVQHRFGFDFMRGDMSHVQMRPAGVPAHPRSHYDSLQAVKKHIRAAGASHFAYFAESFLAPPNVMAYGDEVLHLEACDADVVLGDLQSTRVDSEEFARELGRYVQLCASTSFAPCFTVMTADKDDPRFDEFYRFGNVVRMFLGLFLSGMPSYVGLGFETRERHDYPAPNERYTKLYVFQESHGPKATHGPYRWGRRGELFAAITRLRLYADHNRAVLGPRPTRWLIPPNPDGPRVLAWTHAVTCPKWVFVANIDSETAREINIPKVPGSDSKGSLVLEFSTSLRVEDEDRHLHSSTVASMEPGEGRVYRIQNTP